MATIHFKAKMEIIGVNPYVLVTSDQATTLQPDWRRPMPILVRVNGHPVDPWRINMMPAGDGSFYLYLHGDVRKASNTGVGDAVSMEVSFDPAYRVGPPQILPQWFADTLIKHPTANKNWEELPPSRQKEIVRYLDNLKSQEARDRNLEKTIIMLYGAEGHFMGRDWKNGK